MALTPHQPPAGTVGHGLDHRGWHLHGQHGRLGLQLAPLRAGLGVDGDAAPRAVAQRRRIRPAIDHGGADGHRQAGTPAGTEPAHQPAVDPAGVVLQAVDEPAGGRLGRAGHRAGRERGRQQGHEVHVGPQPGGDPRRELPHRGVPLEAGHAVGPHRARPGHPTEVVAHQVDDHDQLGPLLGRRQQGRGSGPVVGRPAPPGAGALHGPRQHPVARAGAGTARATPRPRRGVAISTRAWNPPRCAQPSRRASSRRRRARRPPGGPSRSPGRRRRR